MSSRETVSYDIVGDGHRRLLEGSPIFLCIPETLQGGLPTLSTPQVMESFAGLEHKFSYSMYGHSGPPPMCLSTPELPSRVCTGLLHNKSGPHY
jgi:hypothetical protein